MARSAARLPDLRWRSPPDGGGRFDVAEFPKCSSGRRAPTSFTETVAPARRRQRASMRSRRDPATTGTLRRCHSWAADPEDGESRSLLDTEVTRNAVSERTNRVSGAVPSCFSAALLCGRGWGHAHALQEAMGRPCGQVSRNVEHHGSRSGPGRDAHAELASASGMFWPAAGPEGNAACTAPRPRRRPHRRRHAHLAGKRAAQRRIGPPPWLRLRRARAAAETLRPAHPSPSSACASSTTSRRVSNALTGGSRTPTRGHFHSPDLGTFLRR
jgi:hypothetical protein